MGNCISFSFQSNAADGVVSHCCEFTTKRARYVSKLEGNIDALKKAFEELTTTKTDLLRRVNVAEELQQMKRLDKVERWISWVEAMEAEVNALMERSAREINRLCLWGCCSKNYISTYKFGKMVSEKLSEVTDLQGKGAFEVVAERAPIASVVEMPLEPTVGMETLFDKVWRDLNYENVGIMGLYGMGGVGKTTLLKNINNNFLKITTSDYNVIWVVVSQDYRLDNLQNVIGEKIGYSEETWKRRDYHNKATDIFSILSRRKFVLLLDDIWDRIDLTELGVPLPTKENGSKVVFTTRSMEVCCQMDAQKMVEVKCLAWDKSWKLFQEKVGEVALNVHPDIPSLAEIVAKECDGLPLALITIGRAMACKRTLQEWKCAIQVLKNSASDFSGMRDKVLPLLKFSYDNLSSEKVKSCFLYCALFPEDWPIDRNILIDYWMSEGFLDEYLDIDHAKNQGCDIIGSLLYACLLEDIDNKFVKMHDVVRDMALWIACDCGKAENRFLVKTNAELLKLPMNETWNEVSRISLQRNRIESLSGTPTCPNLLTLFLNRNSLSQITDSFFDFMPKLRVLDLAANPCLTYLPVGISKLVSLQYLNLSNTAIEELPSELKNLVMLKYLNLNNAINLDGIPHEIISSFLRLQRLNMFFCGLHENRLKGANTVQCGGNELLVQELLCLKDLNTLEVSMKSLSAFERLSTSEKLQNCTRALFLQRLRSVRFLYLSSFVNMKRLEKLMISDCRRLEEIKIDWDYIGRESHGIHLHHSNITNEMCFLSLRVVGIVSCKSLKDLTCLIFAPKLSSLNVSNCPALQEIICLNKLAHAIEVTKHLEPFKELMDLDLRYLPSLMSIHQKPLSFPHLMKIEVLKCRFLKKLPIGSNITKESGLEINGEEYWWDELEWDDEATRDAFLPCFHAISEKR